MSMKLLPFSCLMTYPPWVQVGPAAMWPTCAFELVLFAACVTGAAQQQKGSRRLRGHYEQFLHIIAGKDEAAPALFLLFALLPQLIVLLSETGTLALTCLPYGLIMF